MNDDVAKRVAGMLEQNEELLKECELRLDQLEAKRKQILHTSYVSGVYMLAGVVFYILTFFS
jgi:hypothetical protein